jgi:RNA 2',3'-cyclic 3'-phosphodiesterase
MPRTRTFIAIELSKPIRDRLVSLQQSLAEAAPDVKWVEPANLHVTLLFLGEVDDRELPAVCRAVQEALADQPAFAMSVAGAGCFPNPRRPRVLWVGIGQGVQEVVAVHDAMETPLLALGCYRREKRRYTPHVTLGRRRGEGPADALGRELAKHQAFQAGELSVSAIHVMASELTSAGPSYSVLSRAKLA